MHKKEALILLDLQISGIIFKKYVRYNTSNLKLINSFKKISLYLKILLEIFQNKKTSHSKTF
jgi:hypothetical protein